MITFTALQWLHTQLKLRFHTMLCIDFASLDLNFCFCYTVSRGENMKENPLMKYSEQLAVEIEKMCKSLDNKKDNANTILQIRKSSSSVFANISEAQYPQSLPDMLSKFKISRKECVETESWLKLLFSSGSIDEEIFKKHRNLCGRIQRMLTSSCITIEKKISDK